MRNRYSSLDGVRAIGAIMILLFHLAIYIDANVAEIPQHLNLIQVGFAVGVYLFFMLSGLALGIGYYHRLKNWSAVKRFYVRRFLRIAPLYYALIVVWGLFSYSEGVTYSVQEYLFNITFMFNLVPGQSMGIVGGVGWMVSVLCIFYLLFPLIVLFFRKIKIVIIFLVGMLIFGSISREYLTEFPGIPVFFKNSFFIHYLPFFLIGFLIFLVLGEKIGNEEFLNKTRTKLIGVVLLVSSIIEFYVLINSTTLALVLAAIPIINVGLYIWGFILGSFIVGLVFFPWKGLVNGVTKFIADRSYGIYLLHPCLLIFAKPVHIAIFGNIENGYLAFLVAFLFTFAGSLGIAILTHKCIEQPAIKYGPAFLLKPRRNGKKDFLVSTRGAF